MQCDEPDAPAFDRRRLLLGVAALTTLAACRSSKNDAAANSSALSVILQRRKVRVGFTALAPWAIKDANSGKVIGWYPELAQAIFKPLDIAIEFLETSWGTFAAGIQGGQYDLSIVPSYPTIQRATALAFTDPISDLANSALVRADSPFNSVFELDQPEVRLVAIEGEQSVEFVRNNLQKAQLRTVSGGDFNLLYAEVLTGRADAAFGYTDSITAFIAAHGGVRDISPGRPYSVLPICWATSYAANDFRLFLNASLAYLKGNGTSRALQMKYG